MRTKIITVCLVLFALTLPVAAQSNDDMAAKLVQFQMAIVRRGPSWSPARKHATTLPKKHLEYIQSMLDSGRLAIAGPIKDDEDLIGVYIFRTKSADDARTWVLNDPEVVASQVVIELHPWWAEDVMKKSGNTLTPTTAYLAFLSRGDKWTPEQTPATEEIQKAHLANIRRLAELKKLVIAGPFGDEGTLRGIFVFRVGSLEEARTLSETDPAVKAGRLALQIHPWVVPDGILP